MLTRYIGCLWMMVFLLASCASEEEMIPADGELELTLLDAPVDVASRATPAEIGKPLQADFHLNVVRQIDESSTTPVYDGNFVSRLTQLKPGTHHLEVSYGEDVQLGWDKPYYAGTADVDVASGEKDTASIYVSVKNSLMSVVFENPDIFSQVYTDYGMKVSVGNKSLIITQERAAESAYFPAQSDVKVEFVATTQKGTSVTYSLNEFLKDQLPLSAAQHAIVHLSASNVGISVLKVEVTSVPVSETIPLEWLPKPKVSTADGFTNNSMDFVETERKDAVISYALASPLQDAVVTLNFNAPQYPELMELNGTYVMSKITVDQRTKLQNMGIVLPICKATECKVDLTGVTELMQTDNGASTANTVTINVKANNRWSSGDKTQGTGDVFTMNVQKPTMSVSTQVEHMWSKEFTVDEVVISTGNAEKIKANLKYQYSVDGVTWYDCNDNQRHKFSSHPSQKNYLVRACYRNAVGSSTADVTLETPTQLPNSGMEEWHDEAYNGGGMLKKILRMYYPWSSSGSSFWNTNNEYTTRYRSTATVTVPYNSFAAVSYVPQSHSGSLAAEIRSTASGSGNTVGTVDDRNKLPGILFTGEFSADLGVAVGNYNYTKTDGRDFDVRPSSLTFWYKYTPYNSDTWKARLELWDANKNVIAASEFSSSNSQSTYQQASVNLNYIDGQKYEKCKYIYVIFQSTITEGSSLPYRKVDTYTLYYDMGSSTQSYNNPYLGSTLTIDDISLVYDK